MMISSIEWDFLIQICADDAKSSHAGVDGGPLGERVSMARPNGLYCARVIVFVFRRTPSFWKPIMQPRVETPTALAPNCQI